MAFNIIVKKYEHFNRALPNWNSPQGKYIGSKRQYEEEMARGGFIPFKEVEPKTSKWIPSADLQKTISEVKSMADRKGNIYPTEKYVRKLKSMGVNINPKFMTKDLKGGIDAS